MKSLKAILVALLVFGGLAVQASAAQAPPYIPVRVVQGVKTHLKAFREPLAPAIVYRWGEVDWLPELAAQAGWPPETWARLEHIILRESGGCPRRIGGSKVDKDCNLIGWDGSNHKSDSGLLQINGLNWDSKRIGRTSFLEKEFGICTQEPLLDPFINLVAGKAIYDIYGWSPWTIQHRKVVTP